MSGIFENENYQDTCAHGLYLDTHTNTYFKAECIMLIRSISFISGNKLGEWQQKKLCLYVHMAPKKRNTNNNNIIQKEGNIKNSRNFSMLELLCQLPKTDDVKNDNRKGTKKCHSKLK